MASNSGQGSAGGAKGILNQIGNGAVNLVKRLATALAAMRNRNKT